jgi:hypothetical protein|tara:strand:+ start:850 stop:1692 length:843 start_codon:yes stop_codon:yes gene_type:complete
MKPNLVTVVGKNTHMLPHMLQHYKDIVDNVYVVVYRHSEDDGILEEIEALGIKPYKVVTAPKYNWEKVTELYNEVKLTKPDEWWIVSDDDELQVYPRPVEDIINECEQHGYDFVTGGFIDRIGNNGTFPIIRRDTNIHRAFPLAGFFRYPMSKACPNKVTLMKGHQKLTPGQHYALFEDGSNSWGEDHPKRMPTEICFAQVHHFKWDSTCLDRMMEIADIKESYAYSSEYRTMYRAIARSDWKINVQKTEFLVERLNKSSYIEYIDYTHWNKLRKLIIKL